MTMDVYDLETFPNCFLACFKPLDSDRGRIFEISDRRNDSASLFQYVLTRKRLIGFNNMGFDWPVLDYFMRHKVATALELYNVAMEIISSENRNEFTIWNPEIEQVDVFLVNGFDNRAMSTSLKKLEVIMRSKKVQGLPFAVGSHLSYAEIDTLIQYNAHDVLETEKFFYLSLDKIKLREAINPKWINKSDIKFGRAYFEQELQKAGVYLTRGGTPRPEGVLLGDVIFPYVKFKTPVITEALELFRKIRVFDDIDPETGDMSRNAVNPHGAIYERGHKLSKKEKAEARAADMEEYGHHVWFMEWFTEHTFQLDGLDVVMGTGGLHASMNNKVIKGVDIVDLDVTSFYPSIAIVNRVYPEHLGLSFCNVYAELKARRLTYAKGTPENEMLKLSLNSVFGAAGSPYTSFYDTKFLFGITINGQFLILSLAELMLSIEGVHIVQINTDGITIIIPDGKRVEVERLTTAWSKATLLELEANDYSHMWIRDVNNYIAQYRKDGKRKRKGAYNYHPRWHQDPSMLIVPKAAEAAMCDGVDIEDFISANDGDGFDFMIRLPLPNTSKLVLGDGSEMTGVVRYYASEKGHTATKFMAKTETKLHAKGHAELISKLAVWACSACEQTFSTRADWDRHRKRDHKGVKGITVDKTPAEHTCTACGSNFDTKGKWEDHANDKHSSKLVFAQEYSGEPIAYDMRFYAGEARKLLISDHYHSA